MGKYLNWRSVRIFAYVYSSVYAFGKHVGELVYCSGPSMYPTIQDGDLVIAERMSVKLGNIRRGDIVGSLSPLDPDQLLCKRITKKQFDNVYDTIIPIGRVPKGHVYLEGDNFAQSTDSRYFGPVPQGLVQIRLVFRIWPLTRIGWLSNHWFWESDNTK
uniref:Mitochondrial inner membrane protease subunit n=1 Tax=Syphacia muris TaxID=451379 RepID=A0A0N5ASG6_9BILA